MKRAHSLEILKTMDRFPFEEKVLERISDLKTSGGSAYLTYQCICRYMNSFARKYEVPTECDVEKIFLTRKMICEGFDICDFLDEAEFNSTELLYNLASYCDWDYLYISEGDLENMDFSMETEESLEEQIAKTEILTETGKRLLIKALCAIEPDMILEDQTLYVLSIRGLSQFLRYQKSHPGVIRDCFQTEALIIRWIMDEIENVLLEDALMSYIDDDSNEFLLMWLTGSDGYNYYSIGLLNPNWLICMYVLHGLLEHAQEILGY